MSNLTCFFSQKFSLIKVGFLMMRVTIRTRKSGVFIEANKWLCEKTRLLLKLTDQRFRSAARPQNETAEWVPRETGEHRLFHSTATNHRSNCRIGPDTNRGATAVSFYSFVTADSIVELTRELKINQV